MTNQTPKPVSVDGSVLLNQVREALLNYVILPTDACVIAVTLWIAASHAAPAWNTAARLVIKAPEKRCGKSRLLDIIEALVYEPVPTSNASPSATYRIIGMNEGDPPTLLIDEADTIFSTTGKDSGNEDLRGILNAGHQRNRPALRYDASSRQVERIETYAMVALAGIGHMPDTIEDRAVIIRMKRRAPNQTVAPYRLSRDAPPLNHLRKQLHTWIRTNQPQLMKATPQMPLEDRAADTWEPLIAVADLAQGNWPNMARETAVELEKRKAEDDNDTTNTRLLKDCKTAFNKTGTNFLPTTSLLAHLNGDLEAPWNDYSPTGLKPRRLAQLLSYFDIKPTQQKINKTNQRGYAKPDFKDAWDRYLGVPPEIRDIRDFRDTPLFKHPIPSRITTESRIETGTPPVCMTCRTPHGPDQQCPPQQQTS